MLDKNTKKYLKTLALKKHNGNDDTSHVGGLAYYHGYIWIARTTNVGAIAESDFYQAMSSSSESSTVNEISTTLFHSEEKDDVNHSSFLTVDSRGERLWVGSFCEDKQGRLKGVYLDSSLNYSESNSKTIKIPPKANGAAIAYINGDMCLAVGTNYGRGSNSKIELFSVHDGYGELGSEYKNHYKMPPMIEDMCIDNGSLYCAYESGATGYCTVEGKKCNLVTDRICVCNNLKNLFYWQSGYTQISEKREFPGLNMSKLKGEKNTYYINVPKDYDRLIFNDGYWHEFNASGSIAYQTKDLVFPGGKKIYKVNSNISPNSLGVSCYGGSWKDFNTKSTSARRVYVKVPSSWKSPKCYFWREKYVKTTPEEKKYSGIKNADGISGSYTNAERIDGVKLAESFNLNVYTGTKLLGGAGFKLDLSYVPISAVRVGNKVYIAIGAKMGSGGAINNIISEWNNFKSYTGSYKGNSPVNSKYVAAGATSAAGSIGNFTEECKIKSIYSTVFGYCEATIEGNTVKKSTGKVIVQLSSDKLKGKTRYYLNDTTLTFNLSADANSFNSFVPEYEPYNNVVILSDGHSYEAPHVRVESVTSSNKSYQAKLSHASFYNVASIYPKEEKAYFGLNGNIVTELIKKGTRKPVVFKCSETFSYSNNVIKSDKKAAKKRSGSIEDTATVDRSYLENTTSWQGNTSGYSSGKAVEHQKSVCGSAIPQIAATDDTVMMVWTTDIESRSDRNHMALVYSVLNEATGSWSEPEIIDDNGTADSSPCVASDGSNIYVSWEDASRVFDDSDNAASIDAASEIKLAKYSAGSGFDTIVRLTENDTEDSCPNVAVRNGKATVVWKNVSSNAEKVMSAAEDDNYSVSEVYSTDSHVSELATNGSITAFTTRSNDDSEANQLFTVASGQEAQSVAYEGDAALNLKFSKINGTNYLTYSDGESVYGTSDFLGFNALTASDISAYDYNFVSSGNSTKLIISVATEDSSNICLCFVDKNGKWNNPVYITDSESFIFGNSAVLRNGKILLAYMNSEVEVDGSDVNDVNSICTQQIDSFRNLSLDSVKYNAEDYEPGENLPITITLTNNSTETINGVDVTIKDSNGMLVQTENINKSFKPGETVEIPAIFRMSSYIDDMEEYEVTISDDDIQEDNINYFVIGYTDLQVLAEIVTGGDDEGILVTVKNAGAVSSGGKLVLTDDNETADTAVEFIFDEIAPGESQDFLIKENEILNFKKISEHLNISVVADKDEESVVDNQTFVYIADYTVDGEVEDMVNVYFLNTQNWSNPTCYLWSDDNCVLKKWPGSSMEKTGCQYDNSEIYYFTYDAAKYDKIIFSDGGNNQTSDLDCEPENCYVYGEDQWIDIQDEIFISEEDYLLGDANSDTQFDIRDVTAVQKYRAAIIDFDDTQKKSADFNGDNKITIRDATMMQMYMAEIGVE